MASRDERASGLRRAAAADRYRWRLAAGACVYGAAKLPDYAGQLSIDEAAHIIVAAAGSRGSCREYFDNTLSHLAQLGLVDRPLRRLAERVEALASDRV